MRRDKDVTVRKARRCFGCCEMIEKGDRANIQTNTADGKIYDIILCGTCQEKLVNYRYDDEFGEGDLKDEEVT